MAIELLLPCGRNGEVRSLMIDARKNGATHHMIASMFKVPLSVIQRFFDQDCYSSLSYKINQGRV